MKYKVGDRVKVRSDLNEDLDTEYGVNGPMTELAGKTVTIKFVGDDYYKLKEDQNAWRWSDDMFVGFGDPEYIRAYDLINLINENPKEYEGRRYRVYSGSALWNPINSKPYSECIVKDRDLRPINSSCYLAIYSDTILEEIQPEPKQVSFEDALNAYINGMTIKCCSKRFGEQIYKPNMAGILISQGGTIRAHEITEGKWYIID